MTELSVNYGLKLTGSERTISINVPLEELEAAGLDFYLERAGIIKKGENFIVENRKVFRNRLEHSGAYQKHHSNRMNEGYQNDRSYQPSYRRNYNSQQQSGGFYRNNQRFQKNDHAFYGQKEAYKVHLDSIEYFKGQGYETPVEVMAESHRRAIINALRELSFAQFPDGWQNIRVEKV